MQIQQYSTRNPLVFFHFLDSEQLPESNAHQLRELPLLLKLILNSHNSRLFMLLGLNICPIVNSYCFILWCPFDDGREHSPWYWAWHLRSADYAPSKKIRADILFSYYDSMVCFKPANRLDFPSLHQLQKAWKNNQSWLALIGGMMHWPSLQGFSKILQELILPQERNSGRFLKTYKISGQHLHLPISQVSFSIAFPTSLQCFIVFTDF